MSQINELLEYSMKSGASDLHLSVGSIPMVRIHGVMNKLQLPKIDIETMESIKKDILDSNQQKAFEDIFVESTWKYQKGKKRLGKGYS